MSSIVVMGAQWGDEGKGKIVDLLAAQADATVRFQGGNNAGHTLVVDGVELIVHLIPSGILHPDKVCLVGNGVVLDPTVFCREMDTLIERGIDASPARLKISKKTHLIMPYHCRLDAAREAHKKDGKIGTTGRGIGPCYEDKASRIGIRAGDLADKDLLRAKVEAALVEKNALFGMYGADAMTADEVLEPLLPLAERLTPHLADVSGEIQAVQAKGGTVLFEGAQGTHLDIDHGTYPFVTSSNTVSGNAAAGAGVGPGTLTRIIAIVKAYTTRVGAGPFPTELTDADGDYMQSQGHEFGATTGRKRRCGWLDMCILRESARLNGPTELCITKLDVLSGLPELKICTSYEYKGQIVDYPPQDEGGLGLVKPVYETVPGFSGDITGVRQMADLPAEARAYLDRIQKLSGVRIGMVSVGPGRDQIIFG